MRLKNSRKIANAKKMLGAKIFSPAILCALVLFFAACRNHAPTDMRAFAPAETLVYMETQNLGAMLKSLTEREMFRKNAKTIPNFSALENAQAAVVVTGFKTSAKDFSEDARSLDFKPQFAVIADTHAWESANLSLAENQIGDFAKGIYGDDVKLEKTEKDEAKFFVWTARDNRRFFAAVTGNMLYVANSESVLAKCLSAAKNESENLLKNENLAQARSRDGQNKIAFGFMTQEGVAQLGNIFGTMTAAEASEEDAARNFIAENLPKLIRNTTKEIAWTAQKTDGGIEDKFYVKPDAEVLSVMKETIVSAENGNFRQAEFVPNKFVSVTQYNLKNPPLAWQSTVAVLGGKLEPLNAKVLKLFAEGLLDDFGIENIETFLSASGTRFMTARFDAEGEKDVLIAEVKDEQKIKSAFAAEINFKSPPEKPGAGNIWKSGDGNSAAAFVENYLIAGDRESVLNCLKARETAQNLSKLPQAAQLETSNAVAVTLAQDNRAAPKIIEILTEENGAKQYESFYVTETKFTASGIERRTVSDFGLIGKIIEKFDQND